MMPKRLQIIGFMLLGIILGSFEMVLATNEPLLVGATVSLEGRYQEPSLMIQQGYRLWGKQINARGGLLGRKVKLLFYDDKSRPDLVTEFYRKLIEEDKVDLVLSPYGTPLTLAAAEVTDRFGYTLLACASAGNSPWEKGYRYLFGMYGAADRQFIGVLDLMAVHGMKNLSLVYDASSSYNLDTAEGVRQWAKKFKINIIYQKEYRDGSKDLSQIVKEIKAINPDGLILSAYPPDSYELLRQLTVQQYKPKVLAMPIAPIHPDFYKKGGEITDRVFAPSQWEPDERIPYPGSKSFIRDFQEFSGHMPSFHAGSAYASCQLLEQAIVRSNSLDNDNIRNYIAALDTVTVIGRFKVNQAGKQIGHNAFNIQWQKGRKEIVWPIKMQTARPLL